MKNRVKEAWIWYWGDQNGITLEPGRGVSPMSFDDFDKMKDYSAAHSMLFKSNYKGYWSSYVKIEI